MQKFKTVLSIAGSDSIGGAGIQADIRTGSALGVYVMSVVTAVTAQNSAGVIGYEAVSPEMLRMQLTAVIEDIVPDAVKIGMIPTEEHTEVIAELINNHGLKNVVLDPVMTSTSGTALNGHSTLHVMLEQLMPSATLITPNIPEAERILGESILSYNDRKAACRRLLERVGCGGVLLKAGHADDELLSDMLTIAEAGLIKEYEFSHPRIETVNTHGTGCTLSTAIASHLALGEELVSAVEKGIAYLQGALKAGREYSFGRLGGHGPVDHFFAENKWHNSSFFNNQKSNI